MSPCQDLLMAGKRATYHHGDLRAALIAAGVELARAGGPQAVVLREVTRAVGVAPNSAYGHFATLTALREAVAQRALGDMAEAMSADLADAPRPATAYLQEVGRAYVRFALAEPGLFRTAMGGEPAGRYVPGAPDRPETDDQGRAKPDALLVGALDRLVEAGSLRAEDTGRAVLASWATVHGLATMLLDLLPHLTADQRETAIDDTLDVLVTGLAGAG